jgi:hypothetical protein
LSEPVFVNAQGACESITPAYVAQWAGTISLLVVPESIPWNQFLGSVNVYKIRALLARKLCADSLDSFLLESPSPHVARGLQRDVVYLGWLRYSTLVYKPKCGGRGGVAGSQPMSMAVHTEPK